jgi:hypothetical protein
VVEVEILTTAGLIARASSINKFSGSGFPNFKIGALGDGVVWVKPVWGDTSKTNVKKVINGNCIKTSFLKKTVMSVKKSKSQG